MTIMSTTHTGIPLRWTVHHGYNWQSSIYRLEAMIPSDVVWREIWSLNTAEYSYIGLDDLVTEPHHVYPATSNLNHVDDMKWSIEKMIHSLAQYGDRLIGYILSDDPVGDSEARHSRYSTDSIQQHA